MKFWMLCVICTVLCWGAYVPMLHSGQAAFGDKNSALRAFLFVGVAYALMSAGIFVYLLVFKVEPLTITTGGATISTFAGILGAIGALGIVFAFKGGGKPGVVAPLVFAGAPIVATVITSIMHRPASAPKIWFYVGILMAAGGAAMVLRFKPS